MTRQTFELHAELTIRIGETLLANAKRIELLRQIDALHNLTQAAKRAGYSYKGAWDAMDQMAQLSGGLLIERHAGGKGGGRTELTARGRQLLRNVTLMQEEHRRFIARLNKLANGLLADYAAQGDIAMKTSARNQFAGLVVSITPGPVNDEVGILVQGHTLLLASITHDSVQALQLTAGAKVFALVKASSVALAAPGQPVAGNAKNAFVATVQAVTADGQRAEVTMMLASGLSMVATTSHATQEMLGLKTGATVLATIDPGNVLIGVAA